MFSVQYCRQFESVLQGFHRHEIVHENDLPHRLHVHTHTHTHTTWYSFIIVIIIIIIINIFKVA